MIPALTNSRVSSAALYAAMPPVTPAAILRGELVAISMAKRLVERSVLHCSDCGCHARCSLPAEMRIAHRGAAVRASRVRRSGHTVVESARCQAERPRERAAGARPRGALRMPSCWRCCCATGVARPMRVDVARGALSPLRRRGGLLRRDPCRNPAVRGVGPAKGAEFSGDGRAGAPVACWRKLPPSDALASPDAVRDYLRLPLSRAAPAKRSWRLFLDSQNRLLAADEPLRGTLGPDQRLPAGSRQGARWRATLRRSSSRTTTRAASPEPSRADELLTTGAEAGARPGRHPNARPFRRGRPAAWSPSPSAGLL